MIYLRDLQQSDLNYFKALYQSTENMRYIAGGVTLSDEECETKLQDLIEQQNTDLPFGVWLAENDEKEYVGLAYLIKIQNLDAPAIGYFINQLKRGQGYIYQMIDLLLERAQSQTVYAMVDPENKQSIHILKKVGFEYQKDVFEYSSLRKAKQKSLLFKKN